MNDFYVLATIEDDKMFTFMISSFYYSSRLQDAKRFARYDEAQAYKKVVMNDFGIKLSIIHIEVVKE